MWRSEFDIIQLFIVTWQVLGFEFATDFMGKERIIKTKPFKNLLLTIKGKLMLLSLWNQNPNLRVK